jgi:hypothetical protein
MLLACLAAPGGKALAASFQAAGFTFSDERGGFNLLAVSGSGSRLDPLVIVEEITDFGPVLLVIRENRPAGLKQGFIPAPTLLSLNVIKVVINRTGRAWSAFDMELREQDDTPSPYGDGLSFGQMDPADRKLESDSFAVWHSLDEPADRISFLEGGVDPGEAAQFTFQITDPTTAPVFYLLQEPRWLIAEGSPPRPHPRPALLAARRTLSTSSKRQPPSSTPPPARAPSAVKSATAAAAATTQSTASDSLASPRNIPVSSEATSFKTFISQLPRNSAAPAGPKS